MRDPNKLDNYLDAINPNSCVVKKNAVMAKDLKSYKVEDKCQFERLGYFVVDKDSDVKKGFYVWNRSVELSGGGLEKAKKKAKK